MGILNSIKEKIFGKAAAEPAKSATVTPTAAMSTAATSAAATIKEAAEKAALAAAAAKEAAKPVDVEAVIERLAKENNFKGNWRVSIVDFMNSLGLDSSLAARRELAKELNYRGTNPDGSAEKNIWLHKELMRVLAENGGKIPKELLG
jgi:hypothetical protein